MAQLPDESLLVELGAIKKLLVLQALASGYKQKHIAATLGISDATLSRMLPKGVHRESGRGPADE